MVIVLAVKVPWWQSPNVGIFGVAVSLLAIVISLWLWRLIAPRRVLYCWLSSTTALTSTHSARVPDLQVILGGDVVGAPYIVHLRMFNVSRLDIRSSDFDDARPFVIDLGVPVLQLLATSENIDHELLSASGNEVVLEPMLIRSRNLVGVDLLTDGSPRLCVNSSLADVQVRRRDPISGASDLLLSRIVPLGVALFAFYYLINDPVRAAYVLRQYHLGDILFLAILVAFVVSVARDRQLRSRIIQAYRSRRDE
jgi:hypothetical protein